MSATATTSFVMSSSDLLNPESGIEKILDTTLTKDNRRYYKVKWMKITWEAEDDIAYFSNIIQSFWAEYTKECLLQSGNDGQNSIVDREQQFNYSSPTKHRYVSDKDICEYSLSCVLQTHQSGSNQNQAKDISSSVLNEETSDLLSLKNDEMISSTCSAHEAPPSSELLNTHLTGCELDMITYPYKNVPSSFPHDYDYGLSESHLGKFNQEHISSALVEADTALLHKQTVSRKKAKKVEAEITQNVPSLPKAIYKCSFCVVKFDDKEKYIKHEKNHVNRKCPICGKEFQRFGNLKVHLNSHKNIRPFSCHQCDKTFVDKSSLNKHMQVHSNERKFSCMLCSMKFKRAQHLQRHVEGHKQIKRFTCLICKKQFLQKSALEIHSNVHSGNKPFKCLQCSHSFGDRAALRRHTLTHAKEKPLKCEKCGKGFCRQNLLKNHMKSKHGQESEQNKVNINFSKDGENVSHNVPQ